MPDPRENVPTSVPIPPPSYGLPILSVRDIQKALEIAHRQDGRVRAPGAIDGRWSASTQASYDSWVRSVSPAMGDVSLPGPIPIGSSDVVPLWPAARSVLYTLMQIYNVSAGLPARSSATASQGAYPSPVTPSPWPYVIGGGVALVAVGVGLYYWLRK